jgi:hypothetical protein
MVIIVPRLVLALPVLLNVKKRALLILNISVMPLAITKKISVVTLAVVATVVKQMAVVLVVNVVLLMVVLLKPVVVMALLGLSNRVLAIPAVTLKV